MTGLTQGAAVFLDRDGTLIREVGHLSRQEQMEILPGVSAALRSLGEYGFKLVVVTNQSAVARGRLSESDLASIHGLLREKLAAQGAILDAIYYCPHHPTEGQGVYRVVCNCRKPKTGMVDQAVRDLGLNPAASYVVGDQATDLQLAEQIGATAILIHDGIVAGRKIDGSEVSVVADLGQAARWIIANEWRSAGKVECR